MPGVGEGKWEFCSIGTEFIFEMMKKLWKWVVMVIILHCKST